jgi:hypothetical protein
MKLKILVVSTFLLIFVFAKSARADMAPPYQPPGSNISPSGQTQVQMVTETVILDAQYLHSYEADIRVSANFKMRNLGTVDENLQARFPLENPAGWGDGYGNHPQIKDFAVKVNGKPVPVTTIEEPSLSGDPLIKWASFNVIFRVNRDVQVDVTYTTAPVSDGTTPLSQINYILETGAGWRGSIGAADIILRLAYSAEPDNVMMDTDSTTPGGQLDRNEVHWHWDNLEPTRNDNFKTTVIWPDTWRKISNLQASFKAKPNSVNAAIALAEAYRLAGSERHGFSDNKSLADQSQKTLEQALTLRPDSSDLHAELATILWWRYQPNTVIPTNSSVQLILNEINRTLELDAQNQKVLSLFQEMQSSARHEGNSLPTPGPSPTPSLLIPSSTPSMTSTSIPTAKPKPTVVPTLISSTVEASATPISTSVTVTNSEGPWPWLIGLVIVLTLTIGLLRLKR